MNPLFRQKFLDTLKKVAPLLLTVAVIGYAAAAVLHFAFAVTFWAGLLAGLTTVFIVAMIAASAIAGYLLSTPLPADDEEDVPSGDTTEPLTGSNPTS